MYSVKHVSYCGMVGIPEVHEARSDARTECAHRLRRLRKRFPVVTLTPGAKWEIQEPEGAVAIPDACGTLVLRHVTFECRECGHGCETRDNALACCADDGSNYCEEGE